MARTCVKCGSAAEPRSNYCLSCRRISEGIAPNLRDDSRKPKPEDA